MQNKCLQSYLLFTDSSIPSTKQSPGFIICQTENDCNSPCGGFFLLALLDQVASSGSRSSGGGSSSGGGGSLRQWWKQSRNQSSVLGRVDKTFPCLSINKGYNNVDKIFGFILVLVLLRVDGTSNSTCKSNCSKDALACLLIISDSTPTFSNKMIGFHSVTALKIVASENAQAVVVHLWLL